MDLSEKHLNIVKGVLEKYPYKFYVFGSRIKGKAKKLSDLDLCYKENISDSVISKIEEEFENSDLPFKVELVSYNRCADDFKKIIDNDLKEFS